MDIRTWLLCFLVASLACGCSCDDMYGDDLLVVVPVHINHSKDTISTNDTVSITFQFRKTIELQNAKVDSVRLEGFNFFSKLIVSEVSDTLENYSFDIFIAERIGELEPNTLFSIFAYQLYFEESSQNYTMIVDFCIKEEGVYLLHFDSFPTLFESYNHPWLKMCDGDQRNVDISYSNSNTNITNFEFFLMNTKVDYLQDTQFDMYKKYGAQTFIVVE